MFLFLVTKYFISPTIKKIIAKASKVKNTTQWILLSMVDVFQTDKFAFKIFISFISSFWIVGFLDFKKRDGIYKESINAKTILVFKNPFKFISKEMCSFVHMKI